MPKANKCNYFTGDAILKGKGQKNISPNDGKFMTFFLSTILISIKHFLSSSSIHLPPIAFPVLNPNN